jgi:hypothetical protein
MADADQQRASLLPLDYLHVNSGRHGLLGLACVNCAAAVVYPRPLDAPDRLSCEADIRTASAQESNIYFS